VSGGFRPVWVRFAVLGAVIVGIALAYWLFGVLASSGG
jgi:hypothetical protein